MQQTVLKEHNLDPAIKSNLDSVATPSTQSSTLSTSSALNLDSTSNSKLTFNISADAIKPIVESTEATKPTVVAPTNTILKEEEAAMLLD